MPDDFCHALTFGTVMMLKLMGDSLINVVPEHSMQYTGHEFPEADTIDIDAVMSALRG